MISSIRSGRRKKPKSGRARKKKSNRSCLNRKFRSKQKQQLKRLLGMYLKAGCKCQGKKSNRILWRVVQGFEMSKQAFCVRAVLKGLHAILPSQWEFIFPRFEKASVGPARGPVFSPRKKSFLGRPEAPQGISPISHRFLKYFLFKVFRRKRHIYPEKRRIYPEKKTHLPRI